MIAVQSSDGWHRVKEGHVPVEGEWNTPTACGKFVTMPFMFVMDVSSVADLLTCKECLNG